MGFDDEKSFVMAERLKQLREEKGLSHEKLSKALFEQYGVKVSSDSLINYEVADSRHTKAYKNQGMRVEYLRYLADYYGVSSDYLLGLSVPKCPDITVRKIMDYTGLSDENILALHAWKNINELMAQEATSNLPEAVIGIKTEAAQKQDPGHLGVQVTELISRLINIVSRHPRGLCSHFDGYVIATNSWREYQQKHPDKDVLCIDETLVMNLKEQGFDVMGFPVSAKWHLSFFCDLIRKYLSQSICEGPDNSCE